MNDFKHSIDPSTLMAITEINAMVVGAAPAMALANEYVTLANSQAMAAYNAVFAQQQAWITAQSSGVAGTLRLLERPA